MRDSLSLDEALDQLQHHLQLWAVIDLTRLLVLEAATAVRDHHVNNWDAQIWAAARVNGIRLILSEDFSDRAILGGVRFLNPFLPDFRLAEWI
jgi:predicted nucleic acid-binding protein